MRIFLNYPIEFFVTGHYHQKVDSRLHQQLTQKIGKIT